MKRHGLHIEPLDVFFFRDGRPFEAAMRGMSGLPLPQTLAGAVRTALLSRTGFNFQAFSNARRTCSKLGQESRDALKDALREGDADERIIKATFHGPWPAVFSNDRPVPLLAQPLDRIIAQGGSEYVWLRPRMISGWADKDGLLPLIRDRKTESKAYPKLFSLPALKKYFGNETTFEPTELFDAKDIYDFDDRCGIGVNPDTVASADGMIYGIRFLAMKPRISNDEKKHGIFANCKTGLYAEIESDFPREDLEGLLTGPVPFGGESRYATIALIDPVDWPKPESGKNTKWLLVSPGFIPFSKKSERPIPDISGLKAAVSGAGIAVSGWDVAKNGPRATRFAIPAGAVYYFEGAGPPDGFLGGSDDDKAEGWGYALPGTWEESHD